MNGIFRRLLGVLRASLLVTSLPLLIDLGFRWHMAKEEQVLEDLAIDTVEFKGATLEDALWEVTRKVHTLGHPEVQFTVCRDGHQIPGFHGLLVGEPDFNPGGKLDLSMALDPSHPDLVTFMRPADTFPTDFGRPTLGDLLRDLSKRFDRPCVLRGHRILAAHTPGSTEPFDRATIVAMLFFNGKTGHYTPAEFEALRREIGIRYFEGMSVRYVSNERSNDRFDFYAPTSTSTIDLFEIASNGSRLPPRGWEQWKLRLNEYNENLWAFLTR